jgi:flavin-dependent dehydrogenase
MREVLCRNRRAAYALEHARPISPWLAVSLEGFGRHAVTPAPGLLLIGDAASFIDPFTGSGMLMALESGELAAGVIGDHLGPARAGVAVGALEVSYREAYKARFDSRLRVCSMIRRAAFVPGLAQMAIGVFGASERLRRRVSRATRSGEPETFLSASTFK